MPLCAAFFYLRFDAPTGHQIVAILGRVLNAEKRGGAQRSQNPILCVRCDIGKRADKNDNERERPCRRDLDQLANQRARQARFFGDAHANHRAKDDGDDAERDQAADERREQIVNALNRQKILDGKRLGLDFIAARQ